MTTANALRISSSSPTGRFADELRMRALQRLYERRDTVDELIEILERYEGQRPAPAPCVPITVGRKCW
jgi:hypothetical protein